ncbi:hypothetical protein [Streptomyces sp. NBC_01264]|uniref:hypothetical protein n=1 Tax=Streptomyces sp. NBC_01264 TaxID=2903804 RepID=UPI0022565759|nr:hypothetical protein [Streptomyces sp. NBC_01264]MCX4781723.1 hypothetical protein [Streptomyces sp. NBC_01264]
MFRAVISGGRLMTHDGKYPIHTDGTRVRYVIAVEHGDPVIFVDQYVSAQDSGTAGGASVVKYRALDSHAQIEGQIACAGEVDVNAGKVTYIDNQSGTFQPTGRHFAAILHLVARLRILSEKAEFAQFVARPQNGDVDLGALRKLLSDEVWNLLRK